MKSSSNKLTLLAEIAAAFNDEARPGDEGIVANDTGIHAESLRIQTAFKGQHWREVSEQVLATEPAALSLMNTASFRHYLPAYMSSLLRDGSAAGNGIGTVVQLLKLPTELDAAAVAAQVQRMETSSQLADGELSALLQDQLVQTNAKINSFISCVSSFTQAQAQSIHHFLVFARDEISDEAVSNDARLAIQRYWFRFV